MNCRQIRRHQQAEPRRCSDQRNIYQLSFDPFAGCYRAVSWSGLDFNIVITQFRFSVLFAIDLISPTLS